MASAMTEKKFQIEVNTALKNQSDIVFISYSGITDTEDKIKFALAKILERNHREDYFTPLLSCIKELIANATKANAKKMLIEEGKIVNPDNAQDVVKQVRSVLNETALLEYGLKAKNRRLTTRTYLKQQGKYLIIEVINNLPLSEKEQNKVNAKIENASRYDNIAEFYMEHPDPEAEGMGLGLSMIVVMLKNIDIPHKNFVVTSNQRDKTYARILVPLT